MAIIKSLVSALVAFNALTDALPSPSLTQGQFTLTQQATGKRKFRSGPIAVEATYKKYGVKVPEHIRKASIAAQQGSVTATPEQYDEAYLCPVSIGTPAQTLNMDFDTGSADLWVFSSEQPASQLSGHTYYTPGSSSSSSLYSGESWSISYGDGSGASGNIYRDKVVIGPVTATTQAVECATSASSEFVSDTANDGLVGLAFDSINQASPQKVPTFINTVQSSLTLPLFAANLKHGAPGSYDFGFINTASYTGSFDYVPVNTAQGFWQFTAGGYSVGSTPHTLSLSVIADTGTSIVYLPSSVCRAYWSQVSGARNSLIEGGYVFPCSSTLPTLSITIDGHSHTIPGSYLNYAPVSGSTCFGGLQSSASLGLNVLGDVFLKSQYVVFNVGNNTIGFAQQS